MTAYKSKARKVTPKKTYTVRTNGSEQKIEIPGIDPETGEAKMITLLNEAIQQPGMMEICRRNFWQYSFGNQFLAMMQLGMRDAAMGPIATYRGWQERGRQVKKGEKAITLCMPISGKRKARDGEETKADKEGMIGYRKFLFKAQWFTVHQTESVGEDGKPENLEFPTPPDWDLDLALTNLGIELRPYEDVEGESDGYACMQEDALGGERKRVIAVNPLCKGPLRVLVHEMAHHMLGHFELTPTERKTTVGHSIREVEAEGTAYLICCALGDVSQVEEQRGYLQNYLRDGLVTEAQARKIMDTATKIINAGQPKKEEEVSEDV